MRIDRNLAAALLTSGWTALVSLAVIPLYVRYLGIEGYGLIGFFATAQALVHILDFGMATTINREVARRISSRELPEARALLHTMAVFYWAIAIVIAIVIFLLAPLVASSWLSAERIATANVSTAVALIGLVIACRWPGQLYLGALMGAQRNVISSVLSAALVTVAAGGAIFILACVSPTIQAFFAWQAVVGFIYVLVVRSTCWRILGREGRRLDRQLLKEVWRFSAGVAGIMLIGIALSHVDKLILSRLLSLQDYGQYMLAFAVAGVLYLFSLPIFNVLYPRFSTFVQAGDTVALAGNYHLSTRLLSAIVFPAAMFLSVSQMSLFRSGPAIRRSLRPSRRSCRCLRSAWRCTESCTFRTRFN